MNNLQSKYEKITKLLIQKNMTISTMESATSGFLASLLTDTEGASSILKGAYITYSNEAKILNGVDPDIISTYGVYSTETASAMAKACQKAYSSNIGIGVTGTFGNIDPANPQGEMGTVFFSIVINNQIINNKIIIPKQNSRHAYKEYTSNAVADCLLKLI